MVNAAAVVLAAGKGTRMKTDLPKVLVPAAGRPMIDYVLDALEQCCLARVIVVVGYEHHQVRAALANRPNLEFVLQWPPRGTGHAVMVCREALTGWNEPVLILAGDSPMVRPESLRALLEAFHTERPACLLGTAHKTNPRGLGRIVRDARGEFLKIVEEKDATAEERQITEVNLSCYVFDCRELFWALERITNHNAQGEYYLTDCPGILKSAGRRVLALPALKVEESLSVNTLEELAAVEQALAQRKET